MTLNTFSPAICNTTSIGIVARDILRESPPLKVAGQTSRGLFLTTPPAKIIFISYESYRGPLTLNIEQTITSNPAQVHDSRLLLGDTAIPLDTATVWQPHPAPQNIVPQAQRLTVLQYFLERAQSHQPSAISHQPMATSQSLISNLGLGTGLTPTGDDVVIGYLLTLNRFNVETRDNASRQNLNQILIHEAKRRTTTLSANLIECAAQGLADERLLRVIDCLFTGDPDDHALEELLGWGNTSGLHVLLGMKLAICG